MNFLVKCGNNIRHHVCSYGLFYFPVLLLWHIQYLMPVDMLAARLKEASLYICHFFKSFSAKKHTTCEIKQPIFLFSCTENASSVKQALLVEAVLTEIKRKMRMGNISGWKREYSDGLCKSCICGKYV